MQSKSIFLVRHGQTEWNLKGRLQGHTDIPLNEKGLVQANQAANFFKGLKVKDAHIISSDLKRAAQTAKVIGESTSSNVHYEPLLREVNLGQVEGLTREEIRIKMGLEIWSQWASFNEATMHTRFPEGESKHELLTRIQTVLEKLIKANHQKQVILVSHGLLTRCLIHSVETWRTEPAAIPNCAIYELIFQNDRLSALNLVHSPEEIGP